jgi:hypothetical protein
MSFKNTFLNFLRLIFESFMHVIKFEKHLVSFSFQKKSQISGFGGLGGLFKCSLATESLSFQKLKREIRGYSSHRKWRSLEKASTSLHHA